MKKNSLCLATLLLITGVGDQERGCKLPNDLFARRSALVAQMAGKQPDAALSKELERIDEEYFQFMVEVARSGTSDGKPNPDCCRDSEQDPIADLICKLSRYLQTERKQTELLVESVPNNPRSREALWALDKIAYLHARQDERNIPALFKPSGPVTMFLEELYRVASHGNKEALSKFLELYPFSDGEYAEEMDDHIEKLFTSNLDLVLRRWSIFERHQRALLRIKDTLPNDEKQALTTKLQQEKSCVTYPAACARLRALLAGG